jgi:hypothetical protein
VTDDYLDDLIEFDRNYYQVVEVTTPSTLTIKRPLWSRVKYHVLYRWSIWYRYYRGKKVRAYREWWRERP